MEQKDINKYTRKAIYFSFNDGIFLYISAIECSSPLPLVSGRLIAGGQYFVGSTAQYMCDEGFVLIGEPIISCTEAAIWSHAPPFCKYF